MKLTVFGAGYVGLVTGACLADLGHHVLILDTDAAKVASLREWKIPNHEPGLSEIVRRNARSSRLRFARGLGDAPREYLEADAHFVCVGTPPRDDGSADLSAVQAVIRSIAERASAPPGRGSVLVFVKSTVPVGTGDALQHAAELMTKAGAPPLDLVSNPEFLKEGEAIADFFKPDRVVVGAESEEAGEVARKIYAPLQLSGERPFLLTDRKSSELIKYASNAMLALRISFMNEISRVCRAAGADVHAVRIGVGADSRIGKKFLYAGPGYGGSCFPKDVRALAVTARALGAPMATVEAAHEANEEQGRFIFDVLCSEVGLPGGDLRGTRVGVWGLAFKPETDDVRESPAAKLVRRLLDAGAEVVAHDPEAGPRFRDLFPDEERLRVVPRQEDVLAGADALALMTEWRCYRNPDWASTSMAMRQEGPPPLVLDARNIWSAREVESHDLRYVGVGVQRQIDLTPGEGR